jgi:hypothetical protein
MTNKSLLVGRERIVAYETRRKMGISEETAMANEKIFQGREPGPVNRGY